MQYDNFENLFYTLINRQNSFENYPIKDLNFINKLVINGFKSNQINDHVTCEYCDVEIKNWCVDECIELAHVVFSPNCAYACKIAEQEQFNQDKSSIKTVLVKSGCPKCLYENMSSEQSRTKTFLDYWPIALRGMVSKIVNAGLFYSNFGDETICFFCDCRVRDWHNEDDPWERHILQNPNCFYVLSIKEGTDLIRNKKNDKIEPLIVVADNNKIIVDDEKLNENLECKICLQRQRDAVLLPCRHFCVCVQCYFCLNRKCPTCRQDVINFIKIFVV